MRSDTAYFLLGAIFSLVIIWGGLGSENLSLILFVLFITIVILIISSKSVYRGYYTLCFGEAAVLSMLPSSLEAGIIAQLVLFAILLSSAGVLMEMKELLVFLTYSLVIAGTGMVLASFEQVTYPYLGLILVSGAGIILLVLNEYRIRTTILEHA